MSKRARIYLAIAIAVVAVGGMLTWRFARFPPDTTPEGAYMRITVAIAKGDTIGCFAYLEEASQHAAYSIHDYARKSAARIEQAYPEDAKARALPRYRELAAVEDGQRVWVLFAHKHGWVGRLRRDLSGASSIEVEGERATITTARGTRYSFRRRPNGIWGLTLFTAELEAEAQHLARDWGQIDRAAADYESERKQ
jgi:hypothetical protein